MSKIDWEGAYKVAQQRIRELEEQVRMLEIDNRNLDEAAMNFLRAMMPIIDVDAGAKRQTSDLSVDQHKLPLPEPKLRVQQ